jgi:hypothetical protein
VHPSDCLALFFELLEAEDGWGRHPSHLWALQGLDPLGVVQHLINVLDLQRTLVIRKGYKMAQFSEEAQEDVPERADEDDEIGQKMFDMYHEMDFADFKRMKNNKLTKFLCYSTYA